MGLDNHKILLLAQGLSKHYANRQIIFDLSVSLYQGEILGLLGVNGAGKSTTLQMLSGVIAADAGSIVINDYDLLAQPKQAKHHLGYLPEQPPLYKELTVIEYLRYCAQLHDIPKVQQNAALQYVLERCGLTEMGKRLIANLSKGFQQRVGIAQAIIHNPAVIILDEPTVGLDPLQIKQIRALIQELSQEHGIILSTHILPEVQAVCDRVQIINKGRTVFNGVVKEQVALEQIFIDLAMSDSIVANNSV
jgi:ABC-2 type transport system ATP-binding protein